MASRPWFIALGLTAAAGLGFMTWNDPNSLLPHWIDELRGMANIAPSTKQALSNRPASETERQSAIVTTALAPKQLPGQSAKYYPQSNPLGDLEIDTFKTIIARPLFSPNRRPPQPRRIVNLAPKRPLLVPRPKPAPRRPEISFSIVGTITNRSEKLVVLKDQRTGRHISASKNAKVNGWRIADIQSTNVVLKQGQWQVRLSVFAKP